jgi:dimethylargininase
LRKKTRHSCSISGSSLGWSARRADSVSCVEERVALVRRPSRRMAEGIVTYGERAPVDAGLAADQHAAYVRALEDAGWGIREVSHSDELPDSAFVEDTLVACGGLAVLARPGAAERRAEVAGTEEAVRALGLETARIEEPGTLDGGDVLQVGRTLYAGRGGRTNAEGIRQLRRLAGPRGFTVVPVPLHRVLHLKSAVTALPDGTVIAANPSLLDTSPFPALRIVPEEAGSHVILLGNGTVLMAASAPRSAELLDDWGFDVVVVDIGEFEKMEGCVTCLSVLVQPAAAAS